MPCGTTWIRGGRRMKYVWAAYSLVWIAIFAYTLLLGSRQRKLERELFSLQKAVGDLLGKKTS
jgi:CcmD family protein